MTRLMVKKVPTQSTRIVEMAQDRLMLEEFLVAEANIDARDNEGRNALFWAIKTSHRHNIDLLLSHDISLMIKPNYHALFHCIKSNDLETFDRLFKLGQDINMLTQEGDTLLMTAVKAENIVLTQYLINHGINLYAKNIYGKTALDYAKKSKNSRVYELVHYKIVYENMQNKRAA